MASRLEAATNLQPREVFPPKIILKSQYLGMACAGAEAAPKVQCPHATAAAASGRRRGVPYVSFY